MRVQFAGQKSVLKAGLLLGAIALSACTTVPVDPQRPTGPVAQRPDVQPVPEVDNKQTPADTGETEAKEPEEDVRVVDRPVEVPDEAAPYFNNREGLTLPHMQGRDTVRLGLLLPFSASNARLREEAQGLFQAAELSLFNRDDANVVLIALDTQGTEAGARSAARAAISQGADVILGPVIAGNVRAAAGEARRSGTPVLAFSNDQTVAGRNTYLLSFPPEAEVDRVVDWAANQGVTRFAFLGPDNAYGRRVLKAYDEAVARRGGTITVSETYRGNDISVMQEPAQKLARLHLEAERVARENGGLTPQAFEAVLMPEGGTALRSLAPLLPFNGVDPADVQFMGTSRWDDEKTSREPALNRGVFAGADKDAKGDFVRRYERAYGDDPTGLASLAYDAVNLGAYVASGDPKLRDQRMQDAQGFSGVDGYVRFGPDGRPERGLAVYRIRGGSFRVEDPAPRGPTPDS